MGSEDGGGGKDVPGGGEHVPGIGEDVHGGGKDVPGGGGCAWQNSGPSKLQHCELPSLFHPNSATPSNYLSLKYHDQSVRLALEPAQEGRAQVVC